MSRAKRIVLVALMVGLMAQGAGAAEGVSHGSWFESVVQAIVSFFGETDAGGTVVFAGDEEEAAAPASSGDEPELGDIVVPWG